MGGAGKFGSMKGGYHFSFMCDAPFTLRNYAGCQIERCAHQSRDERNLLERILICWSGIFRFPYASFAKKEALLVGDRSLSFSRTLAVEGFSGVWALGDCAVIPINRADITRPRSNTPSREGKVLA